jgi:plastocyanin
MSGKKERTAISRSNTAAIIITVVAVVILAAGLSLPPAAQSTTSTSSSSTAASSSSQSSKAVTAVSIPSGAFNPSNPPGFAPDAITIVIGTNNTVTWTNNDSAPHTVTSTGAPSSGSFDSGSIAPGQTWTHTFTTAGTYHYTCSYHSWMKGTIIVEASA